MPLNVLVFAEKPEILNDTLGFTSYLKEKVGELKAYGFTIAPNIESVKEYSTLGTEKLYYAKVEKAFPDQLSIRLNQLIDEVKPDVIVGAASKTGNEVLSKVAGLREIPMLTEIVDVKVEDSKLLFMRAILGGRAISVEKPTLPVVVTVPLKKYQPPQPGAPCEIVEVELPESKFSLVEVKEKTRGAVNIEEAEIVIGVGRGFRNKEDLRLAEELANLLGGAVGCSRPIAADYGWLPEDSWIGISGKKVRAKLYMPIGISGAPQHMTAAMDSKIIVAVNKDKSAPVFQYTDYGIVADLYKFLPILIQKIKERLGK